MIPWFWVVTNPVKEGFGMPHFENRTGIEPWTSMAPAVSSVLEREGHGPGLAVQPEVAGGAVGLDRSGRGQAAPVRSAW